MKKNNKGLITLILLILMALPLIAEEKKKPFSLQLTTDFAYYPASEIIPGDWTHVVLLASYTTVYTGVAGLTKSNIFEWQCSKYKSCGLAYDAQIILAYQMPIALRLAGVMTKFVGYYDGNVYGEFDKTFGGDFAEISISPVLQFTFSEKDDLSLLFDFSSVLL